MPVKHSVMIEPISEDEFHLLDHKIMKIVLLMHKDLGRFYDEKIYQKAIQWINFNHDKIEFITIFQ